MPAAKNLAADEAIMHIQDKHVGRVIGKQGTFIREIQAASGAVVQVRTVHTLDAARPVNETVFARA